MLENFCANRKEYEAFLWIVLFFPAAAFLVRESSIHYLQYNKVSRNEEERIYV